MSKYRKYQLKAKYALSDSDVTSIIEYQNNCCPLCMDELPIIDFVIDHDHLIADKRKSVRGILHIECNIALGVMERRPYLATGYVQSYLEKPPAQEVLQNVTPDFSYDPTWRSRTDLKLSFELAEEIRELYIELKLAGYGSIESRTAIAEVYAIGKSTIKDLVLGRSWNPRRRL